MDPYKDWESVFSAVGNLVSQNKTDDALERLRQACDDAVRSNRQIDAALFCSTRGSLFAARGEDEAALREFEAAEVHDPANAQHKLITANHLVTNIRDFAAAVAKLRDALQTSNLTLEQRHYANSLLGVAFLEQGDTANALETFSAMTDVAAIQHSPLRSLDLRLAQALATRRVTTDAVRKYVVYIRDRAEAENAHDILERVSTLEAELTN